MTLAVLASRIRDWIVMTDELQYTKLATSIADTLSPIPTLRGVHASIYSQLYPALIAAPYGLLPAEDAFRAAHVVNAVVFASAAVPAYLLGREASLSERWAVLVAAFSVAVPWNVHTAFLMTEAAAYPAFLWACLAILRAVDTPSPRRDMLALAGVGLATLARTQFLSLALVLFVTALVHNRRGHRVLVGATAVALLVAAVGGTRVLGNYAVTADRWPLPWKAIRDAGAHLDVVAIPIGLLPLLLGGAWILATLRRRDPFALFALVTIVVVVMESSSFDARFAGLVAIHERYVFYLAPLLFAAMARGLVEGRFSRAWLLVTTYFVAVTIFAYGFPTVIGVQVDAVAAVLNDTLRAAGGPVFIAGLAIVVTLAILIVPLRPPVLAAASVAAVMAVSLTTSAVAWHRLLTSRSPSSREVAKPPPVVLDWIDRVLPKGADVATVPYASYPDWGPNALLWWDVEFWNKTVDRAYVVGDRWDYAPFPHQELDIDRATGTVAGTEDAPRYVVAAASDARFQLAAKVLYSNFGLNILDVERPYRVRFASSGLDADGWSRPGRPARVHVFETASAQVTLQRADGSATTVCGSRDVELPDAATGRVGSLPLGPTPGERRIVGVRVTAVELRPSC